MVGHKATRRIASLNLRMVRDAGKLRKEDPLHLHRLAVVHLTKTRLVPLHPRATSLNLLLAGEARLLQEKLTNLLVLGF